ncbi:MAG: hypothetical protein HFI72_07350 [Peptococcaceae bacterium]|jgi:hypothetical protein|nr:hypothetical protein [Peptococcaceae bacterium]
MTDEEKRQFEILKEELIKYIFLCRKLEQELQGSRQGTTYWYEQHGIKAERLKKTMALLRAFGCDIANEDDLDKGDAACPTA